MTALPPMFRVRQHFDRPRVDDVVATVREQLRTLLSPCNVQAGQRAAIAVGSRGIADLTPIVRTVVGELRALGVEPLIVPAMGSHGGGAPEGQTAMLATLGISPESVGCPLDAAMEAPVLATLPEGTPLHFSAAALAADHVLMVNRVKPHTTFTGPYGSGMAKMLLLGLGKHEGAKSIHAASRRLAFEAIVRGALPALLPKIPLRGGLAILENAYEEVARVVAVPAERILADEPPLLEQAIALMARLPFDALDVLVVDRMGKNISGTGLDTNVVGRKFNDNHAVAGERPAIARIVARALTEETRGNALGLGICDFVTERLASAVNHEYTFINAVTSNHIGGCKLPPVRPTDEAAIAAAVESLYDVDPAAMRIVRIASTLELTEFECSVALESEVRGNPRLEILGPPRPWPFDQAGALA
ncbi:MAG: [Fe-S]-binding protein [Pirellulales bacterium]|nr:[Fe-S]-binding protein [Pirellulales bacterium]